MQARLVLLVAALCVFGVALLPAPIEEPVLFGVDKLKHIAAFLVLTVLARAGWPSVRLWILALGLTGFGVAIELAQGLSGWGRTASLADVIADLIGLGLGVALIDGVRRLRVRLRP